MSMMPALQGNDVHVWWTRLDAAAPRYVADDVLSADERARLQRLATPALQQAWGQTRAWLRHVLGAYTRKSARDVVFAYTPTEKPLLQPDAEGPDLHFNLSHSGDLALVALTRGRAVGVDVEVIRPRKNLDALITDYFSPSEQQRLRSLPADRLVSAFLTCWTRKEAYLKGVGFGLSIEPASITVSIPPDDPQLLSNPAAPEHVREWSLRTLALPSGYVATLAVGPPSP